MTVNSTWVDPSAAGTLDLATGAIVTETWTDGVVSDLLVLGGTDGKSGVFQMPTGVVLPYAAVAVPTGWLACDGSAVSRSTYARLFGILSTTWGAGDGSTTFNLPDMRGRAPIGSGLGSGLTNRALAATGGEETHVLTTAELAAHSHTVTITDPTHNHTQNAHAHGITEPNAGSGHQHTGGGGNTGNVGGGGVTPVVTGGVTAFATSGVTVNSATATNNVAATGITAASTNTGSGTAHNTMPPFAVLNYIIKV